MGRRGAWVAAAAVAAVLAVGPAPASAGVQPLTLEEVEARFAGGAGGGSNQTLVQLAPPKIKGYNWGVVAYKRTPRSKTLLDVRFFRTAAQGTQYQSSDFTWVLPRGALREAPDLSPVSLDTGKGMGDNGFVDMRLTQSASYRRFPAEKGCSGSISIRVGTFGGRFRFNARDEYFKRISMRGVQVFVYREHDYRCSGDAPPPPACPQYLSFGAFDEEAGVAVGASKTPEGKVEQRVVVERELDTGRAIHAISVALAVPEAFEASDDLTSASVDGDAAGPWLSGDLSYVAPPASDGEDEDCGPYQSSAGIATGDYAAHFDSIGDVSASSTGMTATLRREI